MGVSSRFLGIAPYAAMLALQCLDISVITLSKAAMSSGMSHFVFVAYSNVLATLILLPFSLISRRSRPPLTFALLCNIFLLSLIGGTVMQNCVFIGIDYSSPALASAMSNLAPAMTFLLVMIFRVEDLSLRSSTTQVKLLGALVSVSGAMVMTFYKGFPVASLSDSSPSPQRVPFPSQLSASNLMAAEQNWVLGGFFFGVASLCASIWTTVQASIVKKFPSDVTVVNNYYCFFVAIQCALLTLVAEWKNPSAWILKPDIQLLSVLDSGVVGSVLSISIQSWCIHQKGPLFVAMFQPLGVSIAALTSVLFLHETLYMGSVIGIIIISAGFYGFIWAQTREGETDDSKEGKLSSSTDHLPLLA